MSASETTKTPEVVQDRLVEGDEDTVIDLKNRLVWLKKDTYQLTGKWLNWIQSRDYAKELNQACHVGYNDWRLPTLEEAKSLYNKNYVNKDHMGQLAFLHTLFHEGFGFLCWTSDVRNKIQAVRFGYRKGGMMYDDVYRVSRGSTRLVRDMNNV